MRKKNVSSGAKGPAKVSTVRAKKLAPLSKAGSHVKRVKRELGNIASMEVKGLPSQSRLANLGAYAHKPKTKRSYDV